MRLKHIIPALLFCLFTFGQVAAPAFCHFSGKIHLFNSGCADDDSLLLFVSDDGADKAAVTPLVFDTYLLAVSETGLKANGFKLQSVCIASHQAPGPGGPRLYARYRVFRI